MTASTIISLLSAVFAIAKWLVGYLEKQKWIDAGAAEATLKGLQQADEAIAAANQAREIVRSELARDPSKLRAEDEFSRPD
ncbi:MAG TPA: hypothetical protein VJ323_08495 [Bryobacteraceae bacterium]|nr:hypothetical protein [Bryobacteraceae bacterium]